MLKFPVNGYFILRLAVEVFTSIAFPNDLECVLLFVAPELDVEYKTIRSTADGTEHKILLNWS